MELRSTCESSNLDVMTYSFDAISSSYLFTSERDSRYASLVIISQVADLDASKLRALSNESINNFSKGFVASTFIFFISTRIISYSTSMEDIYSIGVHESLSAILCHKIMISISISVIRLGAITGGVLVELGSLTLTTFEKIDLQASPEEPLLTMYPGIQMIPIVAKHPQDSPRRGPPKSPRGPPRSSRKGPPSPQRSLQKNPPRSPRRVQPSSPRDRLSSPQA
ncbi:hypothetical protein M9H77_23018 [Catharanthus roseus]|uniref:Uncharacterized protein n=1 Tax=Catharanthus roseus TaxID=4058 RepID=A0ACC0ATU9_CATRO|nr:hypothetical protein M9H77_23018 [Catharanthus roseus]